MLFDYDTPGGEPSGAPASFATALSSEPAASSGIEPSETASEAVSAEQAPTSRDGSSAMNESSSTSEAAASETRPATSQTPATEAAPAEESSLPSNEELNQLMDQYAAPHQAPVEGEIVQGRVVAVADVGAVVDIGGKTEALIPAGEFMEADNPIRLDPGQDIEVQLTG